MYQKLIDSQEIGEQENEIPKICIKCAACDFDLK